jgi:hypothetical protein
MDLRVYNQHGVLLLQARLGMLVVLLRGSYALFIA